MGNTIKAKDKTIAELNAKILTLQPVTAINTDGKHSKKNDLPVVDVQGTQKQTTTVSYVPKQTLPNGEKEKTDIEIVKEKPVLTVSVGDKQIQIPTSNIKEDTKLENGKVVVNDLSSFNLRITTPKEIARIGIGKSNNGIAGSISGNISGVVGGTIFADKKTKAFLITVPLSK